MNYKNILLVPILSLAMFISFSNISLSASAAADAELSNINSISNYQKKLFVVISFKHNIYAVPESFIKIHPGGSEVLYIANGHDITALWEKDEHYSFHLWKKNVAKYLKSFRVGSGSLRVISVKEFNNKISSIEGHSENHSQSNSQRHSKRSS